MAKELIDILKDAAVVRDEKNEAANTAARVGGVMVDIIDFLANFTTVSEFSVSATASKVTLRIKVHETDGTEIYRNVTLPAASLSEAGVFTPTMLNSLNTADRNETTARQAADAALSERINAEATSRADKDEKLKNLVNVEVTARIGADAELLKRIIGKSTASSAYTDPFKYLDNFASEKDENGTVTKNAILVMQDYLLDTLRHSDYRDSFPFIGHMRAHVEGVPIEMWTYVKAWNTASTNGVFVQVVRTNFGLKNGVISSALTEAFHEYFRTVTVGMANGSVTDVTATAWKEITADIREKADEGISKADTALAQIHEERQERAAQDRALAEAVSNERAARTQQDAELTAVLTAETNTRLTADRDEKEARKTADDKLSERITSEAADREASDAELQAKIQDHEDRIWKLENQWYGIEWDTEVSSPAVTRIGNMDLHRTLPIQSRMRGCLLDDNGKVVKYLNPKDWTGEVRDGSRGQVMVEIPMHYRRCETDGTKRRVKMSEYPLPGFLPIPRMYPSAYEATLQRSTKKLCSVVNTDPDFRGGNNNAAWDGTYRSLLGRPVAAINRPNFRTYARNRNNAATAEWNLYTYHVHKALFWLFVVEYATLNSQAAFNAELTAEGYRQGGLGAGVTNLNISKWSTFNVYSPFIPCGFTDSLGNGTGVVPFTMPTEYDPDAQSPVTTNVPRYRGVENPFGHIWKWTDGINVRISPTVENGGDGLSKVFVCSSPALFKDNGYDGYSHVGNEARNDGYVKEIIGGEYGEIMPAICSGAGSTTFFCDNHYTNIPTTETLRGVLFGGLADHGAGGGLACTYSNYTTLYSNSRFGSRLCFLPAE